MTADRSLSTDGLEDGEETEEQSEGQARKSARGMPWHWEPMKDATNCDKPRGAVSRH